jgi:hypothetical protein
MNWKVTEIIKKLWMHQLKVLSQHLSVITDKNHKKTWVQAILHISNFKPFGMNSEALLALFNSALRQKYMQGIKNGKMVVSLVPQPRPLNKGDVNETQQVVSSRPRFLNHSGTPYKVSILL